MVWLTIDLEIGENSERLADYAILETINFIDKGYIRQGSFPLSYTTHMGKLCIICYNSCQRECIKLIFARPDLMSGDIS